MTVASVEQQQDGDARPSTLRPRSPLRRWISDHQAPLLGVMGIATLLAIWELGPLLGLVDPLFTSSPSAVLDAGIQYVTSPVFGKDVVATAVAFASGLALATVVGIPLGLAMGWYRRLGYFGNYALTFAYSSPRIAIVPLLILWFGIGVSSKIALVFLMAIFPMVMSTMTAAKTVDVSLLRVARSLNASSFQMFRTIVVPASIPAIITGIRIGMGLALIGVVVAEFVAADAGLGYRMQIAAQSFQADLLFACLFIVSGTGVIIAELLDKVGARFDAWRPDRP